MIKIITLLAAFMFVSSFGQGQPLVPDRGKYFEAAIRSGLYDSYYGSKLIYGVQVKYLSAFENENEFTITAHVASVSLFGQQNNQLAFSAGYRAYAGVLFFEPQFGFSFFIQDFFALSPSVEVGLLFNQFKTSVQYYRTLETGDFIGEKTQQLTLNLGLRF